MFESLGGSILTILFSLAVSFLLYLGAYKQKKKSIAINSNGKLYERENSTSVESFLGSASSNCGGSSSESSSNIEMVSIKGGDIEEDKQYEFVKHPPQEYNFQADPYHKDLTFFPTTTTSQVNFAAMTINEKITTMIKNSQHTKSLPFNSWYLAPSILLVSSWFILNFVYYLKDPICTWKDLLAWTSYVLGHITVPIVTAVWLYVFHAPGVVKSYGFALGFQNICGVCTHLLFPCAPPWFIHMYGEDAPADYEMLGYAAGLIRVDVALGTHLNSKGFHLSPIVFGAVPSLHSAMAVMTFFFVAYYSRWVFVKVLSLSFVVVQWWATIYLDHHWRLDLFVGMGYATFWFTVIYCWRLKKCNEKFIQSRLNYEFLAGGSTMGMRVFRNTNFQWFFDPLS
ncbi:IPT1 [Candida oxycetoniae]|uniref:IPT1 n=1 Tax=Candida oxycetoniae TaxID=497107 RepID=A0AAI9T079_9ASCO|nr:IPT1 [Candida oxycetoniae]KAI3405806.2 IPT1 [Candida oxycetoniae]